MNGVTIRPARPADFDELIGVFARAELGGPSMAPELAFVQGRLGGEAFVADAGSELVGASAAVVFGSNGWIGGVAVLPEWRGAGLGTALTATATRWIVEAGASTASLYATDMGRPVYEQLGFAADGRWLRLTIADAPGPVGTARTPALSRPAEGRPTEAAGLVTTVPDRQAEVRAAEVGGLGRAAAGMPPEARVGGLGGPGNPDPSAVVRPARASDLDAVVALDRAVTGEERGQLLRAVWGSGCLVAEGADGRVVGFHAPKPTGGPGATIARGLRAGAALQAAWQQPGTAARVVLPEANAAGRRVMETLGYQVTGAITLMRRGPAPPHRPQAVFGGFNLFWG